jgi:uncharacterized protein
MLSAQEVSQLELMVVVLGLAIGLMLGWVGRYSSFCTLGAISDWYTSGDKARLRMWLLAIALAIAGTQALALSGAIQIQESFYTAPRLFWLSNIVGGLAFGFGMALAAGCGSRTLIRIGGGSLKAMVVFLVLAVFAYMAMRGIFGVLRVETLEKVVWQFGSSQDLPTLLQLDRAWFVAILVIALLVAVFASRDFLARPRLILGGTVIGLLVVAGWYVTGHIGFIEEDPNTLEARFLATNSRGVESLTFVGPLAFWLDLFMFWSDKSRTMTFGIATVSGVVLGSLIHAVGSKTFRLEGFQNRQELSQHLIGAALMGVGGVVAFGCTIGQGISGLSLLALGSLLATVSIVTGAWLGLRWLESRA